MSAYHPLPRHRSLNPAASMTPSQRVSRWLGWLSRTWEEADRRRRLARLLAYDDRMLDDMGLTRYDIEQALELPLSENAIETLHRR